MGQSTARLSGSKITTKRSIEKKHKHNIQRQEKYTLQVDEKRSCAATSNKTRQEMAYPLHVLYRVELI